MMRWTPVKVLMVMAMSCAVGAAESTVHAAGSVGDAEPTGVLGDLLDDLIDDDEKKNEDKDAGREPERRDAAPAEVGRHRGDGYGTPYGHLTEKERKHIRITSPRSGDRWEHGDRNVTWSWDQSTANGKVRFELWRGRRKLGELREPVENDGRAKLPDAVSDRWGSGDNFYIVAIDNRDHIGVSDPFTIFGGVLVTYPTDATVWRADEKDVRVTWDKSTANGGKVTIELFKDDRLIAELKKGVPNDGSVDQKEKVLESWGTGRDYRVRVTDGKGRTGYSDWFRIGSGATILYPSADTRWRLPMRDGKVTWDKATAKGNRVDIELWRGDRKVATLKERVPNDGEARLDGVDADAGWGSGDDFRIKVIDGDGKVGESEAFAIASGIEVTEPNRSTRWVLGQRTVKVKWRESTAQRNVRFELWTADKERKVADFIAAVRNDGEATRGEGLDLRLRPGVYRLKAIDATGTTGWSEEFRVSGDGDERDGREGRGDRDRRDER